jgi:hypothetical protein
MNLGQILASQHFAAACSQGNRFLNFPTWYEYLSCTGSPPSPELTNLSDVWLIVAAIVEILLRIAALAAVGIIIYAGIQYSTSQGKPQETSKALSTIIDAAIGLTVCILSAVIVTFIAGSFK